MHDDADFVDVMQNDVCMDERGTYLFNVNRVAYLVEKSEDEGKQRVTRLRIKDALPSITTINKKCPRSGKGERWCDLHLVQTDRQQILGFF
jgi:hypothetical protein